MVFMGTLRGIGCGLHGCSKGSLAVVYMGKGSLAVVCMGTEGSLAVVYMVQ